MSGAGGFAGQRAEPKAEFVASIYTKLKMVHQLHQGSSFAIPFLQAQLGWCKLPLKPAALLWNACHCAVWQCLALWMAATGHGQGGLRKHWQYILEAYWRVCSDTREQRKRNPSSKAPFQNDEHEATKDKD